MACKSPDPVRQPSRALSLRRDVDGDKQCILCGKTDRYMSQYSNWGELEKAFLVKHLGKTPSDESSICKKHFIEAKRHHNSPDFKPKWKSCQRLFKPENKFNV